MALLRNPHLQMPGFNLALNISSTVIRPRCGMAETWRFGVIGNDVSKVLILVQLTLLPRFPTVHRQIVMISITDKTQWDQKVLFNENITSKWYQEIARSGLDMTPKIMAWVIKELQWKADILNKTGYVRVFGVGVIKSDTVISKDLQEALKERVRPLNDVLGDQKDYHPRSDQKVVDLVMGQGELLPVPPDEEVYVYPYYTAPYKLTESGCLIGKIITQTIPLWEKSLSSRHFEEDRIKYTEVKYGEHLEPEPIPEDAYYEPLEAWDASRPIILPEPHEETEYKRVDLRKEFPGQRIQVIVKLANIELTPESPDYEGGSCHIEGQLVGAINLFFPSSGLILSPPRTNASQHRRFTSTIAKILSRVHSLSANMEGATFGCSVPVKA
ncbi:hypothetical protein AO1008_04742 [Aspergillus oryzae 100-8]|nr:hypothetical protein AO1008_04742 [Aspergillus oryzae 100-8]